MSDAYTQMVQAQARLARVRAKNAEDARLDKKQTRNAYIGLAGKAVTGGLKVRKKFLEDEMFGLKTDDGLQKYESKTGGGFGSAIRRALLPTRDDFKLTTAGAKEITPVKAPSFELDAIGPERKSLVNQIDTEKGVTLGKDFVTKALNKGKPQEVVKTLTENAPELAGKASSALNIMGNIGPASTIFSGAMGAKQAITGDSAIEKGEGIFDLATSVAMFNPATAPIAGGLKFAKYGLKTIFGGR